MSRALWRHGPFLAASCVVGALWGCGRLRYDPLDAADPSRLDAPGLDAPGLDAPGMDAPGLDAGSDAGPGPTDAAADDARVMADAACTFGPWSPPERVADLSSADEEFIGEISRDGLTAFLTSNRPGGAGEYDTLMATRSSRAAPFDTPRSLEGLVSPTFQGDATVTADGLDLVLTDSCLVAASRASVSDPFGAPRRLDEICADLSYFHTGPHLSDDGLTLYYTRAMSRGPSSLWVAQRPTRSAAFVAPTMVPGFDETTNAGFAALTSDGLVMYVERSVAGDLDVWLTTRASSTDPWGPLERLEEASLAGFQDGDPTITADGLELYFSSNRPGGAGGADVWRLRRSCL